MHLMICFKLKVLIKRIVRGSSPTWNARRRSLEGSPEGTLEVRSG